MSAFDPTPTLPGPLRRAAQHISLVCYTANKPRTRQLCCFWKLEDLLRRDRKLARPALECLHFWQVADWRHHSR